MTDLELTELRMDLKRANERLRALERKGYTNAPAYNYVQSLDVAGETDIVNHTKKGEIKFRTDISKLSAEQQRDLQTQVQGFLNAQTSTVKGYKESYSKFTKGFNTKYGTNLKESELVDMINDYAMRKLVDMFGSKEAVKILFNTPFSKLTPQQQSDFIDSFGENLESYYDKNNYQEYQGRNFEQTGDYT